MRILNLDPRFSPYEGKGVDTFIYEKFTFRGGEPHIKLERYVNSKNIHDELGQDIVITHRIHSFNDMGLLQITVDALKRAGYHNIILLLPYFPGARQDRLMVKGEPFTSAVYVKALAALKLNKIVSWDLHSDVVGGMFAVLDSPFKNLSNEDFVFQTVCGIMDNVRDDDNKEPNYFLISPDAGSNKKIDSLAKYLNNESDYDILGIVKCDKTRNIETGEISGFEVYADDLEGRDCIIVDDICDGGGTFIGLAQRLQKKNAGNLYLIVTHGIFSAGIHKLMRVFEGVRCSDSFDPLKYSEGVISDRFQVIKFML